MKKEREEEFKKEMDKFEVEKEKKINDLRNDYMDRIKATSNPAEKSKLLEEMGKRLKTVEANLEDEKKRQEAALMKNLKKRQERNKKIRLEDLDKQQ